MNGKTKFYIALAMAVILGAVFYFSFDPILLLFYNGEPMTAITYILGEIFLIRIGIKLVAGYIHKKDREYLEAKRKQYKEEKFNSPAYKKD